MDCLGTQRKKKHKYKMPLHTPMHLHISHAGICYCGLVLYMTYNICNQLYMPYENTLFRKHNSSHLEEMRWCLDSGGLILILTCFLPS
jgi:hypothetical protein